MQQIDTTGAAGGNQEMRDAGDAMMKDVFKQRIVEYMSKAGFRKEIKSMLNKSGQRMAVQIDDLRRQD